MRRLARTAVLGVAFALLLSLLAAPSALGFGESAIPLPNGLAADCSAATSLAPRSTRTVDWVVWCGPARGRFTVRLRPTKRSAPVRLSLRARVSGPGATGRPVCTAGGDSVRCRIRKRGPVTIRGSFRAPTGGCAARVEVQILATKLRSGEGFWHRAWGCPGSHPPATPSIARIVHFYLAEDLGPALIGRRAAVVAKARRMQEEWKRGAPVERWSATAWGAPVDAADAEELALRLSSTEQAATAIPAWIHDHHLGSIYAGWEPGPEGSLFVGFTRESEAMIARLKAGVDFVAPSRVKPFPTPPTYTESQLFAWIAKVEKVSFTPAAEATGILSIGIDVLANKVEVGAEHVAAAKLYLAESFGEEAPIEVVKGFPLVLL